MKSKLFKIVDIWISILDIGFYFQRRNTIWMYMNWQSCPKCFVQFLNQTTFCGSPITCMLPFRQVCFVIYTSQNVCHVKALLSVIVKTVWRSEKLLSISSCSRDVPLASQAWVRFQWSKQDLSFSWYIRFLGFKLDRKDRNTQVRTCGGTIRKFHRSLTLECSYRNN